MCLRGDPRACQRFSVATIKRVWEDITDARVSKLPITGRGRRGTVSRADYRPDYPRATGQNHRGGTVTRVTTRQAPIFYRSPYPFGQLFDLAGGRNPSVWYSYQYQFLCRNSVAWERMTDWVLAVTASSPGTCIARIREKWHLSTGRCRSQAPASARVSVLDSSGLHCTSVDRGRRTAIVHLSPENKYKRLLTSGLFPHARGI